jgi:four helix bundle protein
MAYGGWLMADGTRAIERAVGERAYATSHTPYADIGEQSMAFRFEGLEIFHVAVDFSVRVHELVKKFPAEERFDLTSQARRAANSIVLNIAEGSGRGTKKDFSHFLDMAIGSTFETVACFFIAERQSYISKQDLEKIKREAESLGKRINSFKATLK